MRFNRGRVVGATVLGLALAASACGSSGGDSKSAKTKAGKKKETITVGSANFSESTTIANIYAKALAAKGYTIKSKYNIGAREVYFPALKSGQIDLMPDYAATTLEAVNNNAGEATPDAKATTDKLNSHLTSMGLEALTP